MEILISMLVGAALMEAYAWLDPLAKWLVRRAARQLPSRHREAFIEQFAADIDAMPNSLAKVAFAFRDCTLAIKDIREAIYREGFVAVADSFDSFVARQSLRYKNLLEQSRDILQQSEHCSAQLTSVLTHSLQELQDEENSEAKNAIDRIRTLSPSVVQTLNDFRTDFEQRHVEYETLGPRLRAQCSRVLEAILRIRRRLEDAKPIDSDDAKLLDSLKRVLGGFDEICDALKRFDPAKKLDEIRPVLDAILEAIQEAEARDSEKDEKN